jgi:hypothetical protein
MRAFIHLLLLALAGTTLGGELVEWNGAGWNAKSHVMKNYKAENVKVTAYYETLCPDSQNFINNGLAEALRHPELV